ncbi:MAG: hypothetical protein V4617_08035 [Gemmatimonadota bacterium]
MLVAIAALFTWLKERKTKRDKAEETQRRIAAQRDAEAARLEAREATEKLSTQIERSAVRLERMPPTDLLGTFDDFFLRSHQAAVAAQELLLRRPNSTEAEKAAELVRSLLLATASLAQKFEKSPVDVTFSANVMWYRPWTSIKVADRVDVDRRLRFHTGEPLDGILDLFGRLSVITDPTATTPRIDAALPSFAMPVPKVRHTAEDGWLTLPGAPHAFCAGEMDVCPTLEALIAKCDQRSVRKHLSSAIKKHMLEEVPHIQSFVSLPLARSANKQHRLGVLNINCSQPNMLQDADTQKLFLLLVRPLLWMLAEMIVLLERKHPAVLRAAPAKPST